MSEEVEPSTMSEGRGLLTTREREAIAGDDTDNYRYKTRTYFRRRLEKLERDVGHLEEHDPQLLEELRAVVCDSSAPVDVEHGRRDRERREEPQPEPAAEREPEPAPEEDDVVDRVAEEWDDSAERLAARKAAARGVLEYAREHGGVSKQEAKEEVFPEYPVEGQNPRTWYRRNIRPVLNEVAEYNQATRKYELKNEGEE